MHNMHSLLQRQLRRAYGDGQVPSDLTALIGMVNEAYHQTGVCSSDRSISSRRN